MRQRKHAPIRQLRNVDCDARDHGGVLRHGKREHQAPWPNEFLIVTDVLDVVPLAPIGKTEGPANSCVDVGAHHLARGSREEEPARLSWIEPGVEHTFGRRIEPSELEEEAPEGVADEGSDATA